MNTFCYLGDNSGLNDHIRYLGYYYSLPSFFAGFDVCLASDRQMTFTFGVGIYNTFFAADDSTCWKVRPGQALDNILEPAVGVVNKQ